MTKIYHYSCRVGKTKALALLTVGVVATLFSLQCAAQSSPTSRKPPPVERKGLAVVFDASESACGYLVPGDEGRKVLELVKLSAAQRDPLAGHRIWLLKQTAKNSSVAARDVVEAAENLQSQVQVLAEKSTKSGKQCAPFDGVDSNLSLIFDPQAATANAQAMVLVTDAQLEAGDREKFVANFISWATAAQGDGAVPYAGVALISSPFSGRYYPISEPDAKRKSAGYELLQHRRPLLLMWFARDAKLLPKIRAMVNALGGAASLSGDRGFVQHWLPLPATGEAWLNTGFSMPEALPQLIDVKPNLMFKQVAAEGSGRSRQILADCLAVEVREKEVRLEAKSECADGKPLFDGVVNIVVSFPIKPNAYYQVQPSGAKVDAAKPILEWTLNNKSFGKGPFQLNAVPVAAVKTAVDAKKFTVDSDHCAAPGANSAKQVGTNGAAIDKEKCVDLLDGKTIQLDVFMTLMQTRGKPVTDALLSSLSKQTFEISFAQRSAKK